MKYEGSWRLHQSGLLAFFFCTKIYREYTQTIVEFEYIIILCEISAATFIRTHQCGIVASSDWLWCDISGKHAHLLPCEATQEQSGMAFPATHSEQTGEHEHSDSKNSEDFPVRLHWPVGDVTAATSICAGQSWPCLFCYWKDLNSTQCQSFTNSHSSSAIFCLLEVWKLCKQYIQLS